MARPVCPPAPRASNVQIATAIEDGYGVAPAALTDFPIYGGVVPYQVDTDMGARTEARNPAVPPEQAAVGEKATFAAMTYVVPALGPALRPKWAEWLMAAGLAEVVTPEGLAYVAGGGVPYASQAIRVCHGQDGRTLVGGRAAVTISGRAGEPVQVQARVTGIHRGFDADGPGATMVMPPPPLLVQAGFSIAPLGLPTFVPKLHSFTVDVGAEPEVVWSSRAGLRPRAVTLGSGFDPVWSVSIEREAEEQMHAWLISRQQFTLAITIGAGLPRPVRLRASQARLRGTPVVGEEDGVSVLTVAFGCGGRRALAVQT